MEMQELFNAPGDVYQAEKNEVRKAYEARLKQVRNMDNFKNSFGNMMRKATRGVSFGTDIGEDEDKRLAFTETLRQMYKTRYRSKKIVVRAHTIEGSSRWFTLSDKNDMEATIGHISGEMDLETKQSDARIKRSKFFVPVRYDLLFLDQDKTHDRVRFRVRRQHENSNRTYEETVEIDDSYRATPDGGFFPYINRSRVDLRPYQIFSSVNKKNYKDNCFVYACIQSGVFNEEEINHLRFTVQTKTLPNNRINEIAQQFKCNFIVRRIEEKYGTRHAAQRMIDTRKKEWGKGFERCVDLILYKEHYMINQKVPATTFYLEHAEELEKKFTELPLKQIMLIKGISKGKPTFQEDGSYPMAIFRKMFELKLFEEIKMCEMDILGTTEYDKLNDYVELNYNEQLCTEKIDSTQETKKPKVWSEIYYSDFETNSTVSPHVPYLNCTVYRDGANIHKVNFTGENIGEHLLDYLKSGSLTYFHNLKYDACFFVNTPGWNTQITERSGVVLQIVMTKYAHNEHIHPKTNKPFKTQSKIKQLCFRNSYSIIPSALRKFSEMFNLSVHKEVMAYRLYTQENIEKQIVPISEFYEQYKIENEDKLSEEQLKEANKQILANAIEANAYENDTIDIIKYAKFYCFKDCIVLMKGLEKFDRDLREVFNQTNTQMLNVHNFISISSIGYHFANRFGCFDECYRLSGKPQDFIQRCVSGGRTMTANNQKQYIEGRIQDFDAVSLYPSAMYIMDGVPKGIPKIIPKDTTHEQLMEYDTFFIEINIKKIECKSKKPYAFGQVFRKNDAGSKIFDNKPIDNFYIDKIGLMDLIEFYDIEYELIRGYYFDEGFNKKINFFIEGLFNLRLKYKKEKNPLQSTIKLLLNSIYGKSILKAMKTETKCVPRDSIFKYIWRNYNYISEIIDEPSIDKIYVRKFNAINNHFNLPQFGASVLSWSKHLMNRVMASAEQEGVPIFYQDTDSMHLFEKDLPKIADIYQFKYHKKLIGEEMCQFHNDFDSFEGAVGKIYSRKLIALGKKSYLDILVDEEGHEGYHIRLKGIPHQVILNKCKRMGITVEELYERLYKGEEMEFDLLDGTNAFKKTKTFQQTNLPTFTRKLKFI